MKKQLFFTLALFWCSLVSFGQDFNYLGINYSFISQTTVEVGQNSGFSGAANIPATVVYLGSNYAVTSISIQAFYSSTGLTSVTIPNSVISIGVNAFDSCTGLISVSIPNSVTNLGIGAFNYCINLTSVNISNSLTSISDYAFASCSGLTSVTIPNSVNNIGSYAFANCTGLTSVTIPNSVISIGANAFDSCTGLTSVTVNRTTPILINSNVFGNVTLSNVALNVPSNTAALYDAAAVWTDFNPIIEAPILGQTFTANGINYIVTKDTLPYEVAVHTHSSFSGAANIPTSVANAGNAFSVTSIGAQAFVNCTGLTAVTIPNSVTNIGNNAFNNCIGLTSINIPNSVTSIGQQAFNFCTGLTSITIPNSVTSIGNSTFYGCRGLTSINIPNSVTSIGSDAFYNCYGLTSINIPNSVTSIGAFAFSYCSGLTSVTIPNSVISIENNAFENCTGLTSVTVNWATPIGTDANVFQNVAIGTVNLFVPADTVGVYQAFAPWNNFNIIEQLSALQSQNNVPCFGGDNGTATVDAYGGSAPYNYSWSPSGGNGATAFNLTAGNYTCTINDFIGNSITKNFTITQPDAISATQAQTNVSCLGSADGTATVSAAGGTGSYTYAWTPNVSSGATATGLSAGSYICTITNSDVTLGCPSASVSFVIIDSFTPITIPTFTQVAPICLGEALSSLPSTSNNAVTGTWSPALDLDVTKLYTFTPNAGQCAVSTTMTIVVNQKPIVNIYANPFTVCAGTSTVLTAEAVNFLPTLAFGNSLTNMNVAGFGVPLTSALSGTLFVAPSNGCAPFAAGSMTGKIALIERGLCPFVTKAQNAQDAGAIAVVFYNNVAGDIVPGGTSSTITIPVYSITLAAKQAISNFSEGATQLPVTLGLPPVLSYLWSTGEITKTKATDVLTANTTYMVTVTNTATGCSTLQTVEVAVTQNIVPTFVDVAPVCSGTALSALPTTSLNNVAGTWSPALDNTATTTYTFTPTPVAGQCLVTTTLTIVVTPSTTNTTTVSAVGNYIFNGEIVSTTLIGYEFPNGNCNTEILNLTIIPATISITNDNGVLNAVTNAPNATYQWYNCISEQSIAGQTSANFTPTQSGSYNVIIRINGILSGSAGCFNYNLLANNTFSEIAGLDIYPNPSTGIFNLKLPTDLQIEVYNNLGQLLSSEKMLSGSNVINIADKPVGVYFLKTYDGNNVSTFKIIKN